MSAIALTQILLNGLALGAAYALIALGFRDFSCCRW